MGPIEVRHRGGSYRVLIEPGLLPRVPTLLAETLGGGRRALVSDANVRDVFDGWCRDDGHAWGAGGGGTGWPEVRLTVPPGESSKTRESWARLSDALLDHRIGRDGAVVALGGGVVGDLAGFVAATYMRGIPVVHVPTTLLAMVDASIGGKTGVDTAHGKNLIGAFHHPALVVADPRTLRTLDERHYRAGLAEAVKHAVIADADYFAWLDTHGDSILRRDPETVAELVHRSVTLKRRVVEDDENDLGARAVLNAGHTLGHALEHASAYKLLHGEAVALGLLAECVIAESLGVADPKLEARVAALLRRLGLPTSTLEPMAADAVLGAGAFDKKAARGETRFALPARVGTMARNGEAWTMAVPDVDTILAGLRHIGVR